MTYLPGSGKTFAINLGEGLGNEHHTLDKMSEDFAVLDGKYFKLDVTRCTFNPNDLMETHHLATI